MPASTYLTLDGYTFTGFGVPERINGGGAHQLVVHKLIGGVRIIDAMGADDDPIQWKGRFRNADGVDAMAQAILMDAIRRSGRPVALTYYNQTATVVVKHFTWSFERFFEVPYTLEVEILAAAGEQRQSPAVTQDGAINSDLGLAATLTAGSPNAASQVAPLSTAYANYGPVLNASPAGMANIVAAGMMTQAGLTTMAGAADVPAGTPGGTTPGGDPATMAANLMLQQATMNDGAAAQATLPVIQRINQNLQATGGEAIS